MASYKLDIDPPTRPRERPAESSRARRLGAFMESQPKSELKEKREGETRVLGRMETRRGPLSTGRVPQTLIPQRHMRDPPPSLKTPSDAKTKSNFGFGKPASTGLGGNTTAPELKGKSSRNLLRRKPSSIARQADSSHSIPERSVSTTPSRSFQGISERRPSMGASAKSADAYNEIFTRAKARIPTPKETPRIIPELDRYRSRPEQATFAMIRSNGQVPHRLATQDLPPPTPLLSGTPLYSGANSNHNRYSGYSGSGYSASPSTRFSESPGPGAYSRDTTPTSMSSQSPGIVAPSQISSTRFREGSPAMNRSTVAWRRAGSFSQEAGGEEKPLETLPSLRESVTSSSSNSTVKAGGNEKKKKKKELAQLPPSPPPRKSSQKFKKSPTSSPGTPSKESQDPAMEVMTTPSDVPPLKLRSISISSPAKGYPPVRPSREGAPDLQSQLGESMAIIQSNLEGFTFSQQSRRQSTLGQRSVTSPPSSHQNFRPGYASRLPSSNPSPSPILPSTREPTPAPSGLGIIPDLRPREASRTRATGTRTPSPSASTPKTRFGLFGRRTKTAPEITTLDPRDKGVRKGPAAGTGHEGYGRYTLRGRSMSSGTPEMGHDRSTSRADSSRDSIGSTHAPDSFFLERMSPVIIAGGGEIIENRNASSDLSPTESNTSLSLGGQSMGSRNSAKTNMSQASRTALWPSALPKEPAKKFKPTVPKARRPSDSSDDAITNKPSLAFRRSLLRLNSSTSALSVPRPLNLPTRGVSPSMSSIDASIMSEDSHVEIKAESSSRGLKSSVTKTTKFKKVEKRPKSPTKKWNFFHRSQPKAEVKAEAPVQVAVMQPAVVQAVPHYAMLDSSDEQQDPLDVVDLEDILREAAAVELSNEELDALQFSNYKENLRRIETLHTMTPTPPKVTDESGVPPLLFSSPEPIQLTLELPQTDLHLTPDNAPVRPSRLPQVGRIPKVISARPQATSPKSFSRPFARLSTIHPRQDPIHLDKESIAVGPSPQPSTPELQPSKLQESTVDGMEASLGKTDVNAGNHRDFLEFSPARKNSESTTTSSGGMSFVGTTAVIPEAGADLEEDEIWDEYDDLMENKAEDVPGSPSSSCGVPFQYESYESRQTRLSKMQPKESLAFNPQLSLTKPANREPSKRSVLTTSSVYSTDMSAKVKEVVETAPTPTTPMSFSVGDFISGYGDRNNSVTGGSARTRSHTSQRSSAKSDVSSNYSARSSEQENNSPISQVNLRVGSMTVSKWLTFGHVLFSPAREEITQLEGSSKSHSVLVIDGLGNDDWSFYAAETYPSSTFYNLSPTRPLSVSERASTTASFPLSPLNHRQVQYTSPTQKFPFPSSTFHVVVLRFPVAMPESSYRNIISESKRVLKPGGYLEMAILDLDMLNMGNRSRRAVRGLKVQMQVSDPNISLASASDTVLRLVGKRGFVDVKTCNVGVPVASTIPSSASKTGKKEKKEEVSLADLIQDTSHLADESITKMVARVGRWWFTRCYEMGVLPDGDVSKSIFSDGKVLGECKKWNSSFKLVVAYAQKPAGGRRRGASV